MAITDTGGLRFASGQDFHDHILTDYYLPAIADARNNATVLWDMIPEGDRTRISGKFVTFPVHTSRNLGTNAVGVGGGLPDPGNQGADTMTFPPRHYYGTVKIDGTSLPASDDEAGAYEGAVDFEMNGIADDLPIEFNRMIWNDGSGVVAELAAGATATMATGAGTPYDLVVNSGIEGNATCDTPPTSDWLMPVGVRLAVVSTTGTVRGICQVISITDDDTAVLAAVSGAPTAITLIVAGDQLVRASQDALTGVLDNAWRHEPMGLSGIMSDGNAHDGNGLTVGQTGGARDTTAGGVGFQGVATSNSWNQGVVLDNSGVVRSLTEQLLQEGMDECARRNNAEVEVLISDFPMYRHYLNTLVPDKRYSNTTELHGGHTALDFNGVPWVRDRMAYGSRVMGLAIGSSGMRKYELDPLHFINFHGANWDRVQGEDSFYANLVCRYTFGVDVRERSGFNLVDVGA